MLRLQRGCGYHKVPGSVLGDYMEQIIGKPEEAKQKLLEQFSKEIEKTFPYKPGMKPIEAERCRLSGDQELLSQAYNVSAKEDGSMLDGI